jgi:hypothetical protein
MNLYISRQLVVATIVAEQIVENQQGMLGS